MAQADGKSYFEDSTELRVWFNIFSVKNNEAVCYIYWTTQTWEGANLFCKSSGMRLATIKSHAQMQALMNAHSKDFENGIAEDGTQTSWFVSMSYYIFFYFLEYKCHILWLNTADFLSQWCTVYWIAGRDSMLPRQFSWDDTQEAVSDSYLKYYPRGDLKWQSCLYFDSSPNGLSHISYFLCNSYQNTLCEI